MKKVVPGLIVLATIIIGILGALTIESYLNPKTTLRTQIQTPPQLPPAARPEKIEEDLAARSSSSPTEPPTADTTTTQPVLEPLTTPPEEKPAIPDETKPPTAKTEITTNQEAPVQEEVTFSQAPMVGLGLLTDTGETEENRLLDPHARQVTMTMSPRLKKEKDQQVQKVAGKQTVQNFADLRATMVPAGAYPFSILLETLDKHSNAEQAIKLYDKKGLASFWVKVDLGEQGIKYRLFTGYFPSEMAAKHFLVQQRLSGKLAKNTPYAARIGIFEEKNELAAACTQTADAGFFPSILARENGPFTIFVGAFYTAAGADQQCREVMDKGLPCQTVPRATPP